MSQLFKNTVDKTLLYSFLKEICNINDKDYFLIDNATFKRSILLEKLQPFLDSIKDSYHASKQFYVTRPMKYTSFLTVLRQICKSNCIAYTSKIHYEHSDYEIKYYIMKPVDYILHLHSNNLPMYVSLAIAFCADKYANH